MPRFAAMGTFRFLLAIAVAVAHFHGFWGHSPMLNAQMAVQCFYIVSGFLIALILSRKYDTSTRDGLRLFYSNRALRIFVPYWTFLVTITALAFATGINRPLWYMHGSEMSLLAHLYVAFTNIFIVGQEWTNWLVYDHGSLRPVWDSDSLAFHTPHLSYFHIISQAWTVSLELMFYALAPFLVRRHWLILLAYVAASVIARRLIGPLGLTGSGLVYRFFPLELGLFLAGVLGYRLFDLLEARGALRLPVSSAVTLAMLIMLFAVPVLPFFDDHRYRFYVVVVLALPFLFDLSRRLAADRWLGELSYPVYLCHIAVMHFGAGVVPAVAALDSGWTTLALLAISVAVAAVYVQCIDRPLDRWRQSRVVRTPRHRSAGHSALQGFSR